MQKNIFILGGGISGLTAAYFLQKRVLGSSLRLIEKTSHLGGWIKTKNEQGFIFEMGPRLFKTTSSAALLELIEELRMEEDLVIVPKKAEKKWVFSAGKIEPFFKKKWRGFFPFIKELYTPIPAIQEEESVGQFFRRHFGDRLTQELIDPFCVGVTGGDMDTLSVEACFGYLKVLEKKYGSIVKGMWKERKKAKQQFFSLKKGMQSLVEKLRSKIEGELILEEEILFLKPLPFSEKIEIHTTKQTYQADHVISALPASVLAKLVDPEFSTLQYKSIYLVHLGYKKSQRKFPYQGLGYLVPRKEKQALLGVLWDSLMFPNLNQKEGEIRITCLLDAHLLEKEQAEAVALQSLKEQMGWEQKPCYQTSYVLENAFPQPAPGHMAWAQKLQERCKARFPQLYFTGNFWTSASVNSCIEKSKSIAETIALVSITMRCISANSSTFLLSNFNTFGHSAVASTESSVMANVCQIVSVTNGANGCASINTLSST